MSRKFLSNLNQNKITTYNEVCVTFGQEISQGTLQGTLLCSDGSSTLLNAAVNNNKAIFFYTSFGAIFGPRQSQT